jgi:hypothetical protein
LGVEPKLKKAEEIEIMLDSAGLVYWNMIQEISDTGFAFRKMKSKSITVK